MYSQIYKQEFARALGMSKEGIVVELVEKGFLDECSADYVRRTWKKVPLARRLADRITRMELRGY